MAQISIAAIKVEERLRAVDPDFAAYLAESIQDCGLLQPVVVTRDGQQGYKLIDGAHRLAAVQSLNWIAVEARVLELAETERRAAQVEFLMRLTPGWETALAALAIAAFAVVALVHTA